MAVYGDLDTEQLPCHDWGHHLPVVDPAAVNMILPHAQVAVKDDNRRECVDTHYHENIARLDDLHRPTTTTIRQRQHEAGRA